MSLFDINILRVVWRLIQDVTRVWKLSRRDENWKMSGDTRDSEFWVIWCFGDLFASEKEREFDRVLSGLPFTGLVGVSRMLLEGWKDVDW